MKYMFKFLVVAVLSIGSLIGTSTTARAGTITQTFTYAAMADVDWTHNLNIKQIELTPGSILNDVKIIETVDTAAHITGTNQSSTASTTVTKDQAILDLYDSITGPNTSLFEAVIGFKGSKTLGSKTGFVFGNYVSTNSFDYDYSLPGDTASFIGTGVVPLQVYTDSSYNLSGGSTGDYQHNENIQANLQVQAIYNYTGSLVVPEPSAGLLFGVGGLICWGWRRKAARKA